METWTRTWKHRQGHGNIDEDMTTWTRTWKQEHGDMDEDMAMVEDIKTWTRTGNGKRKTEAQAIFLNPFNVHSLCKRNLLFVRLLKKKQTEVINLQTD